MSKDLNVRGRNMLQALIDAASYAGIKVYVSEMYGARSHNLMTYGLGHPVRRQWSEAHKASGGRLIGWDLGYWLRDDYMRLTINDDHPQRLLEDRSPMRFDSYHLPLREDYHPEGPIILAGLGRKTREEMRQRDHQWEREMYCKIRAAYPHKQILYKPKKKEYICDMEPYLGTIEQALNGASLLVCKHSNVGVDACFAGVPVVCSDGAAAALYGNDLFNPIRPSFMERLRFLRNLAWWQWKPSEAKDAWLFIKQVCS
jgi:hypothetical protein